LQGIKKVSISDVAQKAGVTSATVYNQFGSKDALVREVVIEWFSKTLEDYKEILESEISFKEKLQKVISFKSDLAGKMHGEFLMAATADIDPLTREYFEKEYMVELSRCVDELYDEGRRQGYVDPELSTERFLEGLPVRRIVDVDPSRADFWQLEGAERTRAIADEHLKRFERLCRRYGMRLPSIAEQLGETRICQTPELPGYDAWVCRLYRYWPRAAFFVMNTRAANSRSPLRFAFCGYSGSNCREAARTPTTFPR